MIGGGVGKERYFAFWELGRDGGVDNPVRVLLLQKIGCAFAACYQNRGFGCSVSGWLSLLPCLCKK